MKLIQLTSNADRIFYVNPMNLIDVWPWNKGSEIFLKGQEQSVKVMEDPVTVATLFGDATCTSNA
jgi:hypothetical protein